MLNRVLIVSVLMIVFITSQWSCKEEAVVINTPTAQKEIVDSLISQLVEARNIAPNEIVALADSVILLAQKSGYSEGVIKGNYQKGIGYFFQSDYAKSEDLCELVLSQVSANLSLNNTFKERISGNAYSLLGILKQRQGRYTEAIPFQLKALEKFESIENWENIGNVHSNIAENFRFLKDYEKALIYNEKAEFYLKKLEQPNGNLMSVLQNRGNIYFDQEKYPEALVLFQKTLSDAQVIRDNLNIVNAINNIGASNEKLGNYDIALNNYLKALTIYVDRKDYWGQANTLGNISMIHFQLNDLVKAKQYSKDALLISEEHGFLELEKFITKNLVLINERKGDYREGLGLQKRVQLLQDSLYNQFKLETVNELEQQFRDEKNNRIIAQKDKAIAETELQSQRFRNLATMLGAVFLAVLLGAGLLYKQARFREAKNKELLQKNKIIQDQNEDLAMLLNAYEAQKEKYITLGNHQVQLDDIIYIRYQNRISSVFLSDGSIVEHRVQLSQLIAEINYKSHFLFSQINQNYILHLGNVPVHFQNEEEEKYYYTSFLSTDLDEGRNENFIKTRKRSGLNKKFEREYQRYLRLQKTLKNKQI